jgi:hypothetical protein
MRRCTLAALLALAACRGTPSPAPAPSASASAPASAAPQASAAPCASCARSAPERGPYSLPADDAPTAEADEAPHKQIGTYDDWLRAYRGLSEPERDLKPPRLGVLADLPALPRSTLVFVRSGQLVRVELPAGTETQLTRAPGSSRDPRWTQDGAWLFFLSNREGGVDKLFRMRADGTGTEALTRGLRTGALFGWAVAADGARVAYLEEGAGSENALHVVEVASRREELSHRGVMLSEPAFSADGRAIFFVRGLRAAPAEGVSDPQQLAVLDLATGAARALPNPGVAEISGPQDLGDGRLVFAASADFSMVGRLPELLTMPTSGGAWTAVPGTRFSTAFLHPIPSPDRKKLANAWTWRRGGFGAEWYTDVSVVPLAGGTSRALTSAFPRPFYDAYAPTWAPDSRHLALVLGLCPYEGCDLALRSVVLVDTQAAKPKLAFVAYGRTPAFKP